MPRSLRFASVAAALVLLPVAAASADSRRPCPDADGFTCTRITVPLDRTGTVPGTLSLRFATETGVRKTKALLALTGGPGQPGVLFGPSFASEFARVLDDHELVVLDQRGTGGSRSLSCPEVQGIDSLAPIFAADVAGCAERLGAQRSSFASIETAADIEAMRKKLGVAKLAIYGVSYGTWVAQQYAREYPAHVERLVLDSVVPPGSDPWDLRITESLPRILRQLCARKACAGITADPFADLTAVVRAIQAQRRLRGTIRTVTGGRQRAELSQVDLLYILVSSDLNPFMQSRVPAALVAARRGDAVPLLRLKRDAGGPSTPLNQFSAGLFVTTTCLDGELPYSYADSFDVRAARAQAALEQLPASSFAPFDRASVDVSSLPQICLHWPAGAFRPESTKPMPDVPTLILSGLADMRTPLEGAQTLANEIPHAQIVTLAGSGHDVGDTDYTGCVDRAVARLFAGRRVGTPCKGKTVEPGLTLVPPLSLGAVAPLPGIPGARGKLLRAAVNTIADASTSDNQAYYAGFDDSSAGGLRGGSFEAISTGVGEVLILSRLEFVPKVVLSGTVVVDGDGVHGRVRVHAPDGLGGILRFTDHRIHGGLGGRAVESTIGHVLRTRLATAARAVRHVSRFRLP